MDYKLITLDHVPELAEMYVHSFNAPPCNDKWTEETAAKRLQQMINCGSYYGLMACKDGILCGFILGCEEQFYDGIMFNIKEFCVCNELRN